MTSQAARLKMMLGRLLSQPLLCSRRFHPFDAQHLPSTSQTRPRPIPRRHLVARAAQGGPADERLLRSPRLRRLLPPALHSGRPCRHRRLCRCRRHRRRKALRRRGSRHRRRCRRCCRCRRRTTVPVLHPRSCRQWRRRRWCCHRTTTTPVLHPGSRSRRRRRQSRRRTTTSVLRPGSLCQRRRRRSVRCRTTMLAGARRQHFSHRLSTLESSRGLVPTECPKLQKWHHQMISSNPARRPMQCMASLLVQLCEQRRRMPCLMPGGRPQYRKKFLVLRQPRAQWRTLCNGHQKNPGLPRWPSRPMQWPPQSRMQRLLRVMKRSSPRSPRVPG